MGLLALLRYTCTCNDGSIGNILHRYFWVSSFFSRLKLELKLITHSYGLVGILRPLTVYPSEMVYWAVSNIISTSPTY